MKQEIFKHACPYGVTRLSNHETMTFDTILAKLILKQEHEEEKASLLKKEK